MRAREVYHFSIIQKPHVIRFSLCSSSANFEHRIPLEMSAKVPLTSRWCLIRNELVIGFPDSQSASEYQRANPEGRILSQASREVYLPRPQGLTGIRCSSQKDYSLVLEFVSEEETMTWHAKVLISSVFLGFIKTRAYLPREVKIGRFLREDVVCDPHGPNINQHQ